MLLATAIATRGIRSNAFHKLSYKGKSYKLSSKGKSHKLFSKGKSYKQFCKGGKLSS